MKDQERAARVLWALDIDGDGRAIRAHLVVDEVPQPGDLRDGLRTNCGLWYSWNDHTGWWSCPPDQLPLAAERVHCGVPVTVSETDAEIAPENVFEDPATR